MNSVRAWILAFAVTASMGTTGAWAGGGGATVATTGACCFPDGECVPDQTREACEDAGGEYQGDGVPCKPGTCPPPKGACCFPDGSCELRPRERCEVDGGEFQGDGVPCQPGTCPQPKGACCLPDGSCELRPRERCEVDGGEFQGDGTLCEDVECGGAGSEGCTPGYWKQSQHFGNWAAPYTPATPFADVFDDAFPGMSLLDVLWQGGGHLKALGRHTVAALLNAAGDVDYGLTAGEVTMMFNDAYANGEYESLKNFFADLNERGCPLGRNEGRVPEDLNADGRLDRADVAVLLGAWGPYDPCPANPCPADLTGDRRVNADDLELLLGTITR